MDSCPRFRMKHLNLSDPLLHYRRGRGLRVYLSGKAKHLPSLSEAFSTRKKDQKRENNI
jgi:hypothetical protein